MTQFEFETRTNVKVSAAEFETINNFYMSCEADKDEFCKMWIKMNPGRVTAARIAAKEAAKKEAERDMAWNIYFKLCNCNEKPACQIVTVKEAAFLEYNGIELIGTTISGRIYLRDGWDVAYEINKKFSLRA